jgi:transcriptional regulator with XRE-family HTH domain
MSELFDAVDALVASRSPLPSAEERKRLRVAHGLTLDEVAGALKVRRATVSAWESTKKPTEPRGPEREAYARLLKHSRSSTPRPQRRRSRLLRCPPCSPARPTRQVKCRRFRTL